MTIKAITLPEPGQRIGSECGPGECAKYNAGVVLCHITNRWGTHAVVLMDTGKTETCHSLRTEPGIGWHAV